MTPHQPTENPRREGRAGRLRRKIISGYLILEHRYLPQLSILGVLIGIAGGLGAVAFNHLILLFKYLFFGAPSTATFLEAVLALPWYYRVLAPALGGLVVGPLVTYLIPEARGHGVPEVMEAIALRRGAIRLRVAPLKALASSICIGSGGAAGREGPIVQIGSTIGSAVGRYLKLPPEQVETLLGAGAAAGIAGTFNAPLAGVIFSIEVLLKKVRSVSFAPIVIAAVVGTAVANTIFGRTASIFAIPAHRMVSYYELLFYLGLGVFGAGVALSYTNCLYLMEDFFRAFPVPRALKASLGGLGLGLLGLFLPQVYATGYPVMDIALYGRLGLQLVAALMVGKILATSLTLGSGGSGGIFAPGLFIGAMMGSTYGLLVHSLFPGVTAGPAAYAAVGMGTVFAGATHAPLTSIIILFEMTRDPNIVLPLMLSCVTASALTAKLQKGNIYTRKLLRRGVDLDAAGD